MFLWKVHEAEEELDALAKAMDGKPGDLLFFAAEQKYKIVFDVLGNLRLELARQLDLLKTKMISNSCG